MSSKGIGSFAKHHVDIIWASFSNAAFCVGEKTLLFCSTENAEMCACDKTCI